MQKKQEEVRQKLVNRYIEYRNWRKESVVAQGDKEYFGYKDKLRLLRVE